MGGNLNNGSATNTNIGDGSDSTTPIIGRGTGTGNTGTGTVGGAVTGGGTAGTGTAGTGTGTAGCALTG